MRGGLRKITLLSTINAEITNTSTTNLEQPVKIATNDLKFEGNTK